VTAPTSAVRHPGGARTRSRWLVAPAAALVAVLVNLAVFGVGRLAGGSFLFTAPNIGPTTVDPVTVAGFSAVPLGLGLLIITALARPLPWTVPVASVVAPVLAVVTIALMTVPADFDVVSTVTLAACHVTLAPISVLALRRIGRLS
jgi:hypothetical protein